MLNREAAMKKGKRKKKRKYYIVDNGEANGCPHCPKRFTQKANLNQHHVHSDNKKDICKLSSVSFERPRNLRRHMQKRHRDQDRRSND